ncbi:agenet domain-containing protein [Calothrix sp. UHCC 0171]|uniref:agenet domain-containing protein n=1 Tax=Calothrix sp. UHCC 0171 TaxID=3110245 RepID=UPI002B210631|nr:agenet domain-containing protein [Calothrix sp. UHCC 0171]MEA5569507.1 agenet domain-containing protein [Calothrix sp. UHCC 0171]
MDKSIIQLVDELPNDNITVKVLKALDFVAPGEWNNLLGFDNSIRAITGETDANVIQKIRDRATTLYNDSQQGYQAAIKLYQTIDKADMVMATAALASKVGEKIAFLSFLNNITPKADVTQTIDLVLKIAIEIIAFSKLNGIPQPNPQAFVNALGSHYQNESLMRMVALVCIDGILPLGPDFLGKIQAIITSADTSAITQNPLFSTVSSTLPGDNANDKLGFITQGFNSVQGWMGNLVTKTGVTPQSISSHLGNFIQFADDNLDFVAAFLDQTTNYYEHTGIQTVARHLILQAHTLVKAEIAAAPKPTHDTLASNASAANSDSDKYAVGQTIEVWDSEEEDWYRATIEKIAAQQFFVSYVGQGSSNDEWVDEEDIRIRDRNSIDENGYAIGQKVKVWDEDEEDWFSAIIGKAQGQQYFVQYVGYDSSYDEWVDLDEIS